MAAPSVESSSVKNSTEATRIIRCSFEYPPGVNALIVFLPDSHFTAQVAVLLLSLWHNSCTSLGRQVWNLNPIRSVVAVLLEL